MPMKISVVIPCLNGAETISAQLEALARQQWSRAWEIIVADNGSTDKTLEIIKKYQEQLPNISISIVDASARRGQPYALNVGVQAATGEAILFCDADDEVGEGWLSAMGEAIKKYEFIASRIDTDKFNTSLMKRARPNPQEIGLQQYTYPPYLPHAGGGTLGVRKDIYLAVGGFDEDFPILHDTDFCWKVQRRGTEFHFVPDAVMHMRLRDSLMGTFKQAKAYGEYNVRLYKKYRSLGMPKIEWKKGINKWVSLMRRLPQVRYNEERGRIVWEFGWLLGRLKGCIKCRVLAF